MRINITVFRKRFYMTARVPGETYAVTGCVEFSKERNGWTACVFNYEGTDLVIPPTTKGTEDGGNQK